MTQTLSEALETFRVAVVAKSKADDPDENNAQFRTMRLAYQRVMDHGDIGLHRFAELLADQSDHVRCWVAAELLHRDNDGNAYAVLERLADRSGPVALIANAVLLEYDSGSLVSPLLDQV